MSCVHCSASEHPVVAARSRFCLSCGRRLPLAAVSARRVRFPLERAVEEPVPAG